MALFHSDKGSVNYTIVGTPTIVDGVVSGFVSNDSYLTIGTVIPFATANSWELKFAFRLSSLDETSQIFDASGNNKGVQIYYLNSNQKLYVILHDGTSLIFEDHSLSPAINTWYFLRVTFNGSLYSYDISTNNETWTTIKSVSSQAKVANVTAYYQSIGVSRRYSNTRPFQGKIDLNNTYIKIDGQAWFGVCPVEVKHINYGTSVGYTKVGSPTIVNGVVSGFSDSNYLKTTTKITYNGNSNIEFYSRFQFDDNLGQYGLVLGQAYGYQEAYQDTTIGIFKSGDSVFAVANPFHGENGIGIYSYTLQQNTWYREKLVGNNGTWTLTLYDDNGNELATASAQISHSDLETTVYIGSKRGTTDSYLSKIDLNNTYVKANGKLWFYRPSTNYLVKDGKLVFADSDVYIDDNGTKTYASSNIAPVPSGFTYGTTTTTDVGLVNMVTQEFTAVPGATWGKDN